MGESSSNLTFIFLYCSVSTLNPMVGMVCTASSDSFWRRYRMVVFPALSNPKIKIRTSLDPKRLSKILLIIIPILTPDYMTSVPMVVAIAVVGSSVVLTRNNIHQEQEQEESSSANFLLY
jgi:hypothetical protein